ncbi:hypothetical protein C8R46DRAFT_1220415 [Mycena filopes]|nr:hypothetical protein C8R46DRAFT_1220415 [Mycena filopes]
MAGSRASVYYSISSSGVLTAEDAPRTLPPSTHRTSSPVCLLIFSSVVLTGEDPSGTSSVYRTEEEEDDSARAPYSHRGGAPEPSARCRSSLHRLAHHVYRAESEECILAPLYELSDTTHTSPSSHSFPPRHPMLLDDCPIFPAYDEHDREPQQKQKTAFSEKRPTWTACRFIIITPTLGSGRMGGMIPRRHGRCEDFPATHIDATGVKTVVLMRQ